MHSVLARHATRTQHSRCTCVPSRIKSCANSHEAGPSARPLSPPVKCCARRLSRRRTRVPVRCCASAPGGGGLQKCGTGRRRCARPSACRAAARRRPPGPPRPASGLSHPYRAQLDRPSLVRPHAARTRRVVVVVRGDAREARRVNVGVHPFVRYVKHGRLLALRKHRRGQLLDRARRRRRGRAAVRVRRGRRSGGGGLGERGDGGDGGRARRDGPRDGLLSGLARRLGRLERGRRAGGRIAMAEREEGVGERLPRREAAARVDGQHGVDDLVRVRRERGPR
mmetsp:Transcript_3053/g.7890  ORF Transcript_3053/g.7890 Transcript_3053/m.7890 type:complete len:282 (-) Transcript_3053:936-1781(-)